MVIFWTKKRGVKNLVEVQQFCRCPGNRRCWDSQPWSDVRQSSRFMLQPQHWSDVSDQAYLGVVEEFENDISIPFGGTVRQGRHHPSGVDIADLKTTMSWLHKCSWVYPIQQHQQRIFENPTVAKRSKFAEAILNFLRSCTIHCCLAHHEIAPEKSFFSGSW